MHTDVFKSGGSGRWRHCSLAVSCTLALSSLTRPHRSNGLFPRSTRCSDRFASQNTLPAYSVLKEGHKNSFSRCGCHLIRKCGSENNRDWASQCHQANLLQKLVTMRTGDAVPRLRLHYIWDSHNFRLRQAPVPNFINLHFFLFLRQQYGLACCGPIFGIMYSVRDDSPFSATSQLSAEKC
ncbi:hypothetical protein K443DRAFT_682318 [Laccaria amethystina LaAM-08-1]|uniref:Uncharacterized protein n=1 Tax=Laccaria amethystina LaAM-08-1 TaxID=1095629 RepID=A0A0C9WKL6_9AGAR|nr:hypothetical protein K443DRAFT_682318 [Laccaria amethystina LaAM-08-1]